MFYWLTALVHEDDNIVLASFSLPIKSRNSNVKVLIVAFCFLALVLLGSWSTLGDHRLVCGVVLLSSFLFFFQK
eukprot:m.56403 g.56403  ORF g.56403 m.56403 type:complete len:74 (-) comp13012_c1_seq1:661-882(-)